jgi:hypothetical protein
VENTRPFLNLSARNTALALVSSPEDRPKVKASFGNTHTHRARETCFIRTSERPQKRSAGETPTGSRHTSGSNTAMLPLGEMATARLGQTESRLTEFAASFRKNVKGVVSVKSVTKGLVACARGDRRQCFGQIPARKAVVGVLG